MAKRPADGPAADVPPGWAAIDKACAKLYGRQEPLHFAAVPHMALGGSDPLDGISVYRSTRGRPHWHFVSYGMSELYEKVTADPAVSGFGFEFTFRLARKASEKRPPAWALSFLQNLARYVFASGNPFAPGHHVPLNGPIALGERTDITTALFALDPELRRTRTPHGSLQFVQVVGATDDELDAARAWDTGKLLRLLAGDDPLLITDLARRSALWDPAVAARVERDRRRDGSSTSAFFARDVRWSAEKAGALLTLTIGAIAVRQLVQLLEGRTLHGRAFAVASARRLLQVEPSARRTTWRTSRDGRTLTLRLAPAHAAALAAALEPHRGTYHPAGSPLRIRVVPSPITDAEGNVVDIVGE